MQPYIGVVWLLSSFLDSFLGWGNGLWSHIGANLLYWCSVAFLASSLGSLFWARVIGCGLILVQSYMGLVWLISLLLLLLVLSLSGWRHGL